MPTNEKMPRRPRRPAQGHAGFVHSFADQPLCQLARPQRPGLVHLVRILVAERSAADRHARAVMMKWGRPSKATARDGAGGALASYTLADQL